MSENQHPLVVVFYLDRELMSNRDIMIPFTESIDRMIEQKKLNMVCFFLPTDGEEHVECINPAIVSQEKMNEIDQLMSDIKKNFSIGEQSNDANIPNIDV
jgi:hypothetical protein